ncbi:LOW QUALITY PROTEIN: scavenger receptor cysteine-rich type 1 protein M160-like [Sebastes umbrosus]|uniref:LOW QUALITY PROTEIN: scavenger receptor cysteine-rich type 1 protein M160-like n=1 Tax=Sebastes umbrosus TaxID=72105 RepID=UPI0018A126D4|nr:LOW QUALITY PROTEIN: scavenger receptor cysteine-rich type 1 protein M160-like [Sebastes umbrosus]
MSMQLNLQRSHLDERFSRKLQAATPQTKHSARSKGHVLNGRCTSTSSLCLHVSLSLSSSPDSVRLVNGKSLCSGRLEVKSNQSWSSVCEDDFDLQDAEVVCRELGCGAPSVLQGALYGDVEAPVWTKEFQCGGHESALLDCDSSDSDRNTCSPGKAVGLTCSELHNVRLVGGSSRCAGELEMKQRGYWRPVYDPMSDWNLKTADEVCRKLDCGSAVSTGRRESDLDKRIWLIRSTCLQSKSAVRECILTDSHTSYSSLEINCSESVRLVNGKSLCSGRLEVKSNQSNQSWSSVCEDDFDLQDAEVVCRELGCGAPSVLQGALYGDVEAPVWTKEFQCGGHESALLDCDSSDSDRNTCSPGKAVGLICSVCSEPDDVRLVGGTSHCVGRLEMKHKGEWRPVDYFFYKWDLMSAAVVCKQLDCGSVLSTGRRDDSDQRHAWIISSSCGQSESSIRECVSTRPGSSRNVLKVTCSDSIRLVNGKSLCSGRLEVKSHQSNQSWSSVCEDDFDLQDAEVVCRELSCGAPSVLQGALYGDVKAPVWTKEFQCGGHESALLDCDSSDSDRNTCSPGKAVGLTCSEPDDIRLLGGSSRCDGTPEMKQHGEWRPVHDELFEWEQMLAAAVCNRLDCGSAVSTNINTSSSWKSVWLIQRSCVESHLMLRECLRLRSDTRSSDSLEVICSDFLVQPNISFATFIDGVSEANQQGLQVLMGSSFTISCSILPQYPGGSFQLILTTSATSQNHTLPAVNHSAHFLFSAAEPAHRGEYRCVYHLYVFSYNFSSESQPLHLTVSASVTDLIIRLVVLLVLMVLMVGSNAAVYCYCKAPRGQKPRREDNMELDHLGGAGDLLGEEAGAQGTEYPDYIRLLGEASRCAGKLEMKNHGEWRPVASTDWDHEIPDTLQTATCRQLDCDLLAQPIISLSPSTDGVSEAKQQGLQVLMGSNFTITCSIEPQYPGGSFQLIFTTSNTAQNYTLPAVNHSAHFLFSAAEPAHRGEYRCVYHLYVFSLNFSSDCLSVLGVVVLMSLKIDAIRLVGGSRRCSGELDVKHQGVWRGVDHRYWDLKSADRVCRYLDCGSVVRTSSTTHPSSPSWTIPPSCLKSESRLKKCLEEWSPNLSFPTILVIICSDSVRLVNGKSLCSGRLEVKSNQSWSSVCKDDFDLQDAEVVCRELGCGAPSVLQGALYGDVEAPVWTKEFQCGGHESALLDCDSSDSDRNTCSPGKAAGLTCSELHNVRLVGGSSRCTGELEMKQQGYWRPVDDPMSVWNLKTADEMCRKLDCGSAVSTGRRKSDFDKPIWWIRSTCLQSKSAVRECISTHSETSRFNLEINCSESIRLVNGKSLCSGRLEVKSNQSNQSWSSVCEDDFDLQDAEVVCRELGCGAHSVLQGALYGDVEAPVWTKEFQCGGHESALLDCDSSDSDRNTCSPGKAVGLICSGRISILMQVTLLLLLITLLSCSEPDDVRLVGGTSHCVGRLEMKHKGEWRPVDYFFYKWDLMSAAVVCKQLDCGSVLSTGSRDDSDPLHAWMISSSCGLSESSIRECVSIRPGPSSKSLEVTCSDSIRLVNGKSLCSGRLEVKSHQSSQSWSSACEDDFDLQDAEVVCRELGCGAPSVLQGALYGDVEAPVWTKEFQCGGHESALLDCDSSDSDRNTCSPGKAVGLTCSEHDDIRLLGGASRCDGTLEMKQHGEWRPVADRDFEWDQMLAAAVCNRLDCGSAVSTNISTNSSEKLVWWIQSSCVESHLMLRECLELPSYRRSFNSLEVICSDILTQPNISFATFIDGVSEANQQGIQVLMGSSFTISCSILPQYPGGSFQLILTTSATSQNHTLPAVNHSAHFLFSAAEPAHRGEYRCVYHLYVFSYNFSSESQPLHLTVSASVTDLTIRLVVLLVLMVLMVGSNAAVYCYCKAPRGQKPRREDNMELDHLGGAGDLLGEEAGAQGTE